MSGTFRRIYKFYGSESALRNLEQRRLKVSRLDELNDPFESNPFRFQTAQDRAAWKKCMREVWRDKGMICFSDRWSNPVLWSHYAENHHGLALGFDVPTGIVFPIVYKAIREKIPALKDVVIDQTGEIIERAPLIKFSHWRYETEWRLFLRLGEKNPNEEHYFEPFSERLILREVIIGARSKISSEKIQQAVGSDVEIHTARLAFHTFRVVKQRSQKLQK